MQRLPLVSTACGAIAGSPADQRTSKGLLFMDKCDQKAIVLFSGGQDSAAWHWSAIKPLKRLALIMASAMPLNLKHALFSLKTCAQHSRK